MPTWVQWVSFILSLVGSISGVYALVLNHQRTTITKRQEKERIDSKKKAKFSVELISEVDEILTMRRFLILKNNGQADARNVKVKVDFYHRPPNVSDEEVQILRGYIPQKINADQIIKSALELRLDILPPFLINVTWEDDFQNENTFETTLSW
ncbi:hypothetical protein GFV16_10800 [Bacillus megaterium]|uniref:hypothetical protein n=1 Tax=Priestia megaterium TaxID=1404 RepID=UPI0013230DFC|nr:hypothetical protein [Priestia megaterium]MQR86401.1 hypothetical protein [Priestia megaterium]